MKLDSATRAWLGAGCLVFVATSQPAGSATGDGDHSVRAGGAVSGRSTVQDPVPPTDWRAPFEGQANDVSLPESATLLLIGAGLVGIAASARRRGSRP